MTSIRTLQGSDVGSESFMEDGGTGDIEAEEDVIESQEDSVNHTEDDLKARFCYCTR